MNFEAVQSFNLDQSNHFNKARELSLVMFVVPRIGVLRLFFSGEQTRLNIPTNVQIKQTQQLSLLLP